MRNECLTAKYVYEHPLPVVRLVSAVGDKMQPCTQRFGRRPFGVGLLVVGYDEKGPHVYQTCPSSNYYDCRAMAIGARSQSARTYLERNFSKFPACSADELIRYGLYALRESLPSGLELSPSNCSVGIVGRDCPFSILEGDQLVPHLQSLEPAKAPQAAPAAGDAGSGDGGGGDAGAGASAAPAPTDTEPGGAHDEPMQSDV